MKIIFIGPQGSGKGTQAKILSKDLNILHISTGDLLRGAEGDLKQELNDYMNQGKLVPDEMVLFLMVFQETSARINYLKELQK